MQQRRVGLVSTLLQGNPGHEQHLGNLDRIFQLRLAQPVKSVVTMDVRDVEIRVIPQQYDHLLGNFKAAQCHGQ